MSLRKKLRKYVTPNKATLTHSTKSVGQNIQSGAHQAKEAIVHPSGAIGKKMLGQVAGVVGASLGDPYAGRNTRAALNRKSLKVPGGRSSAAGRLARGWK
jgi:hypothetical protein